ncbi:hypothetical protein ACFRI7_16235 [Streptomyces sp. NPDC056716]|uniref:hypothetical protein n=1 Tax=unclassified Streptomyces TaxID=2593676 RepID=UPI0036B506CF
MSITMAEQMSMKPVFADDSVGASAASVMADAIGISSSLDTAPCGRSLSGMKGGGPVDGPRDCRDAVSVDAPGCFAAVTKAPRVLRLDELAAARRGDRYRGATFGGRRP